MRSRAGVTWVTSGNQHSPGGGEQWGKMVKVMGLIWGLFQEPNVNVSYSKTKSY